MAILSKGTTYSDGDQVTSTNLNALVDSATFASDAVDDSTTQLSSGSIIVKDLGISTGKIAASAVTTAKIAASNVTKAKIENLADYKVLGNVSGGAAAPAEVAILDEDNMSSNSATSLATQQSIKAYVDTQLTAEDLDFAGDSGSSSVDLDGQTFTIAGATGLDTAASGQTLTVSLDLNELATETSIAQDDFLAMVDNTDSGNGKITFSNLEDQIFGNVSGSVAIAAGGAATVSAVTVADESSDTTCFPLFATAATGSLGPKSGSNLTFNSSTGLLTATTLSGILANGVTGTTQSSGDNSTKVATTAYVDAQVATSDALSEVLAVGNTTGSTNIVVSNGQSITTNTIAETTSGSGVTIDGVLIKDNAITASGEIDGGSLDISGNADIDGTLETDALSINGTTVTSTAAELNILDGVTSTAAELNYNDTGASVGTVVASKTVTVDSNKDVSSFRNITLTGELDAATLDISGDADIDGTLEADAITVNGTALATVIAGTTVTNATNSAHVLVTDNESTNEENLITFVEGATSSTGNVGLEMDGNFAYNPSTGTVSATIFKGNIDAVDGDFDGTLEADAITIGGTAIGSLFSPLAGGSDIVTTGALNSGSITSGFGSIDNGSSAITTTGVGSFGSLDISGDIDVDGTTNLDVVDIDGAVDMATTLAVAGNVDFNGDLDVDGTANLDAVDIDGAVDMASTLVVAGDANFDSGTLFVDASANKVGIGRDSPDVELHVTDGNGTEPTFGAGTVAVFQNNDNTGDNCRINIVAGTAASSLLEFGDSGDSDVGQIEYSHNANQMNFRVNAGTKASIDSAGSFFVGGTALAQTDSLGVQSNGIIYSARASGSATHAIFYNGSSVVGSITTSTSATAFNTSSDYRLKENETNIIDGIDRLKQLSPYRFNFKVDPDETVDGFFAHEVSDIVPEAITGTKDGMKEEEYEVSPAVYEDVVHPAVEATYDEDGNELTPAVEGWTESVLVTEAVMDTRSVPDYQGIDQSKLVPLLTAALQEAVAKIEALEARVQTLEG